MAAITVKSIVGALKKVPEKKFRIVELAPALVNQDGRPDVAKCIEMEGEINLAVVEVSAYITAARECYQALQRGRDDDGWDDEYDDAEDEE